MNSKDLSELTEYLRRETAYANEKIDQTCRALQGHAYALGLARGKEEAMAAFLEHRINLAVLQLESIIEFCKSDPSALNEMRPVLLMLNELLNPDPTDETSVKHET